MKTILWVLFFVPEISQAPCLRHSPGPSADLPCPGPFCRLKKGRRMRREKAENLVNKGFGGGGGCLGPEGEGEEKGGQREGL